jgi:hypothetical protein
VGEWVSGLVGELAGDHDWAVIPHCLVWCQWELQDPQMEVR